MKNYITILSTKKLKRPIVEEAGGKGIDVYDVDFIRVVINTSPHLAKAIACSQQDIVFVSPDAVNAYKKNIEIAGIPIRGKNIFCLQSETLQAVSRLNNAITIMAARDTISLRKLISTQKEASKVSFICSNCCKNKFSRLLKENNIGVDEIELYSVSIHRRPVTKKYAGVMFFSQEAVEAFFQSNVLQPGIPCFCIDEATALSVREYTTNPVFVSLEADQQSMMQVVQTHFKEQLRKIQYDNRNTARVSYSEGEPVEE